MAGPLAVSQKPQVKEGKRMRNWRTCTLVAGALAAMATAVGCRDTAMPTSPNPGDPSLHETPPQPNDQANFRLTGGGRVDDPSHTTYAKNTPGSHDFATFGFQARPPGSGHITWVEHHRGAYGGGFSFHGRVTSFAGIGEEGCGTFSGTGSGRLRDGTAFSEVAFEVVHACDVTEPGRGSDHIWMSIPAFEDYSRHGLLSGGNIQEHAL
jgi:hypothetical protein